MYVVWPLYQNFGVKDHAFCFLLLDTILHLDGRWEEIDKSRWLKNFLDVDYLKVSLKNFREFTFQVKNYVRDL